MYLLGIAAILFAATVLTPACVGRLSPASTGNVTQRPEEITTLPTAQTPPLTSPTVNVSPPSPQPVPDRPAAFVPYPDTSPSPGPFEFWITGNKFKPDSIRIDEGSIVTWVNKDSVPHKIVPSKSSSNAAIYQDPITNEVTINGASFYGFMEPGGSTSIVLMTAGYFFFYLEDDPSITGLIRVQG